MRKRERADEERSDGPGHVPDGNQSASGRIDAAVDRSVWGRKVGRPGPGRRSVSREEW